MRLGFGVSSTLLKRNVDKSNHLNHDLPNMLLRFLISIGVEGLIERKNSVDDGLGLLRVGANKPDHVSKSRAFFLVPRHPREAHSGCTHCATDPTWIPRRRIPFLMVLPTIFTSLAPWRASEAGGDYISRYFHTFETKPIT